MDPEKKLAVVPRYHEKQEPCVVGLIEWQQSLTPSWVNLCRRILPRKLLQSCIESWDDENLKLSRIFYRKVMASVLLLVFLAWQCSALFERASNGSALLTIQVAGVPQYVLDYAPLVWLDVNETYFPSDMLAQVVHTTPKDNAYQPIQGIPDPLTLENLSDLNKLASPGMNGANSTQIFLTSNDDVTLNPSWLNGVKPNTQTLATDNATSCAIVINDHGDGTVDAFYMYFYAYNQGNMVSVGIPPLGFSREIGDHVGDWEHSMIRFINGMPQVIWYSQHEFGASYKYSAVMAAGQNQGIRPYVYSAKGSHANYATEGSHDHTVPDMPGTSGFLNDYTSRGYLWDPTLSAYFYNYTAGTNQFTALSVTGVKDPNGPEESPVGAMDFLGKWGDQRYPDEDPRQEKTLFFYKFENGPTGPVDKQLNRVDPCPTGFPCIVNTVLGPGA